MRTPKWELSGVRCVAIGASILVGISPSILNAADEPSPARQREFFEKKIRPVLIQNCYKCHSSAATEPKGGLRLDSRAAVQTGGDSGPVLVPGKPEDSLLIQSLRHEGLEMPPKRKLPDAVIADFARWIADGAFDPRETAPEARDAVKLISETQFQERRSWWSLQAIKAAAPSPPVKDADWSAQPIDRFVQAKLEESGLRPSPRADRATLFRRLSFTVRGLPPEPKEQEDFLNDSSEAAWARAVDRMLASPQFGERWARHWMDVVRFGDTYGYEWDIPAKGSWRYRDYLIRAFNDDVPVDQQFREQIAGDLLEDPRIDPIRRVNESRLGTMFFQLGENRHGDSAEFDGIHQEMLDNKIDAFSKAFQGTTIACARCHDHKLDAIAQTEYYALGGAFISSRWVTNTLDAPSRHETHFERLAVLKDQMRAELGLVWLRDLETMADDLVASGAAAPETKRGERIEVWAKRIAAHDGKEPPLEELASPWMRVTRLVKEGRPVAEAWNVVAHSYRDAARNRRDSNQKNFTLVADFSKGIPEGWSVDGVGVRSIGESGDFTVSLKGETLVGQILPAGLFTHSFSPRMNGAVRTPYVATFGTSYLCFELTGGDFSACRTVIDNAFLCEKQAYLNQPSLGWLARPTLNEKGRNIYLELATKTSNPNFPPRVGLGGACSEEQVADPVSWFGVTRVYAQNSAGTPADELSRFLLLFEGEPPQDLNELARRYALWFRNTVERWRQSEASDGDARLLDALLSAGLLTNTASEVSPLRALVAEYRSAEQLAPTPETANGMADVDAGIDYRLNIRGEYDQFGPATPRGYLRMLNGREQTFASPRSGRRELADLVASPENPLTARVFVNRVWQWSFGAGLVTTPDDFGHLGSPPSHPELLDWLANEFQNRQGWSLKSLLRDILLSETWRQSGETSDAARQLDPTNRLLHHYPLRRLEAEPLRDTLLAVSGRLDPQLYGPAINPYRVKEDPQKRLFSGPLDGNGRRSIYTKMTIMEVPRFLATFNQPDPKIPTGLRDVTNTTTQSLSLLNDPMVVDLARKWAERLVRQNDADPQERLSGMFVVAYGRPATSSEQERWAAAIEVFARERNTPATKTMTDVGLWQDVAHALFNTKELIYVR